MSASRWIVGGFALWAIAAGLAKAQWDASQLSADQFDDLMTPAQGAGNGPAAREPVLHYDPMVQQAQARSPGRSRTVRSASRSSRSSRVPYMIGDSPYGSPNGGNQGMTFTGLNLSDINHPIFGGNRFNVSEAGTFLPNDRFLFSYRHLHNTHAINVLGNLDTVNQDRFLFGVEKTAMDGLVSAQIRMPVLHQLDSNQEYFDDAFGTSLIGDRNGEIGNLWVNFKVLLKHECNYAVTAGLGVNVPTARDARISQTYDSTVPITSTPPYDGIADLTIDGHFRNDTVNLIPYLAWFYRPNSRFFHQGFFQTDVPLNGSIARVDAAGTITPDPSSGYNTAVISTTDSGEIIQPTLMRLNLGFGYWLTQGRSRGWLNGAAALFEVHYTHAYDDANSLDTSLGTLVDGSNVLPDIPLGINSGSGRSHADIVNLSAGVAIDLGGCLITNGVIVPVSNDDRYFDFEYNLQVNRRF